MALRPLGLLLTGLLVASSSFWASAVAAAGGSPKNVGRAETERSVFEAERGDFDLESYRLSETLQLSGGRIAQPVVSATEIMARHAPPRAVGPGRGRRVAISVLCSAILPGLGELYLYLQSRDSKILARVPLFLAYEGYNWYAYKDNHDKGRDLKDQYVAFADEHWSEERFLEQHPCCSGYGGCPDWEFYNEECNGEIDYFPYIPLRLDFEEYYENLGKYDAFVYGWDDWDEMNPTYWTPNRTYYWSLRQDSNKHLSRADDHVMLLIVGRVLSMIDAGWLAYRMGSGESRREGWSLDLRTDRAYPSMAIRYRF
jgi:hypothetical protein